MDHSTQHQLFCCMMRAIELKDTTEVEMLKKLLRSSFLDQPSFFYFDFFSLNPNIQVNPSSSIRNEADPIMTRAKLVSVHRRDRVPRVSALPKDIRISHHTVIDSDVKVEHMKACIRFSVRQACAYDFEPNVVGVNDLHKYMGRFGLDPSVIRLSPTEDRVVWNPPPGAVAIYGDFSSSEIIIN